MATAGVIEKSPFVDSTTLNIARVMYPLIQTLMDVPIAIFKQSQGCYGKLWGLCRKVTSAITVDSGHVHNKEFEEVMGTLERILRQVENRAVMNVAPEDKRPALRAIQTIAVVQDPKRKNNTTKENRLCGYCKKSARHNRVTCPFRIADEAKASTNLEAINVDVVASATIPANPESVNIA